jgi:8-oxo-dGTP pyrophosphatase MutT (NUDIX family)
MPNNQSSAPIRNASTVILVRESRHSFEVYLLKRNVKSGFMGGYHVFPGGTVDPEDMDTKSWASHIDLKPDQVEQHLGDERLTHTDVIGFGVAAIRETLEECGVLLATGKNKSSKDYERITHQRLEPSLPKAWFKDRITRESWVLTFSHLYLWSHWITPQQMKSRYDTRFFVALMPPDQTCLTDGRETQNGIWVVPQAALEQNLEGTIALSPPTLATLTQLTKFKTFEELMQSLPNRSWGEPIAPRVEVTPYGPVILEPWDPEFDSYGAIGIHDPSNNVLTPGLWFSRIWRDGTIWKPIGI